MAVLHVVMKTRVGETKTLANVTLAISNCSNAYSAVCYSFVSKTDTRNVKSSIERLLVRVPVAVWHVVMKTRVGETKTLANVTLAISNCSNAYSAVCYSFVLKTDTRNVKSSIERLLVRVPVAVLHVVWKKRVGETKILGNGILLLWIRWATLLLRLTVI